MKIEPDDFITQKEPDTKKAITIIGVSIAVTIIILFIIIFAIMAVKPEAKLTLQVNGQSVSFTEGTFEFAEDRKDIYINKRYSSSCRLQSS